MIRLALALLAVSLPDDPALGQHAAGDGHLRLAYVTGQHHEASAAVNVVAPAHREIGPAPEQVGVRDEDPR